MLLCVVGMIFSLRRDFVRNVALNYGFEIIMYEGDYVSPEEVKGLNVRKFRTKEDIDSHILRNWDEKYVLLMRDAEDWDFLSQRPGRVLIYIETPAIYRQHYAKSLGITKLKEVILSECRSWVSEVVILEIDIILEKFPESWWLLLDEFYDHCSPRKISEVLKQGLCEAPSYMIENFPKKCIYDGFISTYSQLKDFADKVFCITDVEFATTFLSKNSITEDLFELRPSWDQYFLDIAKLVSKRSNCVKISGCVVVNKEGRILATGYSGTPTGVKNCLHGGCKRCSSVGIEYSSLETCFCSHAIQIALLYIGRRAINSACTVYCLAYPCIGCSKVIAQCNVSRVVYQNQLCSSDDPPHNVLTQSNITVKKIDVPKQFFWWVKT